MLVLKGQLIMDKNTKHFITFLMLGTEDGVLNECEYIRVHKRLSIPSVLLPHGGVAEARLPANRFARYRGHLKMMENSMPPTGKLDLRLWSTHRLRSLIQIDG